MSYYPEPGNHIRDKVKEGNIRLTKICYWKELERDTGVDGSNLAARKML